ncbi:GNAT family N-acetyltransferase [Nonomuraea sp. CA-141351]|uniref:GNAT family N-acetyltransferase n=1 Tax=Nonomuraea sp. CA-141351 TaxID=3239996 RepID=UPI003D8B4599
MNVREDLAALWPLFALRVRTPRLELVTPDNRDLLNLARAARDIQPVEEPRYQKAFLYEPSPTMERLLLQHHWRALAHWRPTSWDLHLAIRIDGVAVGLQNLWATDFATVRCVETGSWITRSHQAQGYGTEARAAALEFTFAHLQAVEACSSFIDGNAASERVSHKLGYFYNGRRSFSRDGMRIVEHTMLLEASDWAAHRLPGVSVEGATPDCLELFGAPVDQAAQ